MFKRSDNEIKELFSIAKTRTDIADMLEIDEKSLRYFCSFYDLKTCIDLSLFLKRMVEQDKYLHHLKIA